jgi:hypothetical protein
MRRAATMLLACGVLACMTGCGYTSGDLYRKGIESVHVEIFESKEFRRELEFRLTEAVKKRVATDTPYRVATKAKADTILRGEILEERQAAFAPDYATRLPRDKQLTLAVRVEWKDVRTGEVLFDRPVLLQSADYLPPAGETEFLAQSKAIDRLAARIVSQMYDEAW